MATQGYGMYIQEKIQDWSVNQPITTAIISVALAEAFGIDMESAKKITNVNLKRLADKGELEHIQRGIYGKVKQTLFGKLTPNASEVFTGLLLRDGDKVIGFTIGSTLLNAIGLCSWMPRERHIATNNYRHRIPTDARIHAYKPVITVNTENAPYLQTIEALVAMGKYHVDAENPNEILRGILRNRNISNEKLIWYARKYYGQEIAQRVLDIVPGRSGDS